MSRPKHGPKPPAARSERASPRPKTAAPSPSQPSPEVPSFPVVGIGASAGGLVAFEAFLAALPTDPVPPMAFVLVQHLSPDHTSLLTELIRRDTPMEVFEIEDGMRVRPGCAYVIPPNRDLALLGGALHLMEPSAPRGQRLPIDFFFRSLAQDQRERAIGIVLSGTGTDGTEGVRAIKGEGGMVMAQDPATTEFDGMPRSAINTGLVDYVLRPGEMPDRLLAYTTHAFRPEASAVDTSHPQAEADLKKIFVLLRAQTGHDFSQYKPRTIQRRIERRMALQQIESLGAYRQLLQVTPTEVDALFADLLIGVTRFFRDPEAFEALETQVLPRLLDGRDPGRPVRVWVPACATGEEAYSLAILLHEQLEARGRTDQVQIFATDIDAQAIATARAGVYPAGIAADVSSGRLARYFTEEPATGAWRIHQGIRDLVVFSEQDLLRDPPFSHLDLISCRNLLIYLGAELQRHLIPLFHYALNPGGYLFLGTSETIGEFGDLFGTEDRRWKIFRRREDGRGVRLGYLGRMPTPMLGVLGPRGFARPAVPERLPLRELTEQALLRHLAPVAALVDAKGDVLYLHGRSGRFLEPEPGATGVPNLLRMARPGLRRALATALHKAQTSGAPAGTPGLRVEGSADQDRVDLTVRPAGTGTDTEATLYLVVLESRPAAAGETPEGPPAAPATATPAEGPRGPAGAADADAPALVAALRQELHAKEEYLQTTVEELETSNEQLRSSNEEMQSMNEELQSTNEELETSKEELQSVNEELSTVNAELQAKVLDLSRANNDMNNLLAGTGIGTIFVDHELHIVRFTPAATRLINLIASDVGRPVGHIVSNLVDYDRLVADVQEVLDTLIPKEVDVQTREGRWFAMRIQPYRTLENVIEGAVITFVEVTEVKETRAALARSEGLLQTTQALIHLGGFEWNVARRTMFWTEETYRLHGLDPAERLTDAERLERCLGAFEGAAREEVEAAFHRCAEAGDPFDLTRPFTTVDGRRLEMRMAAEAVWEGDQVTRVTGFFLPVTGERLGEAG